MRTVSEYSVIEDCGGGLHLAVFDGEGHCIYLASGGEYDLRGLAEGINALLAGDNPLLDGWELEGASVGDEAQKAYEDITSYPYGWEVIADETQLYPSRAGAAGERLLQLIPCATGGMVSIMADEEYNAEDWWFAARADGNAPACVKEWIQLMSFTPLYLTPAEAAEVRKWAESLPGWDDGPVHAPHPLLFQYQ
jgi:hypothetical protein